MSNNSEPAANNYPVDMELDASGLNCPLPLLKAKRAIAELESGQCLKVIATDPGSLRDIPAFAKLAGHELLHTEDKDILFKFWLKKA